MENGDDDVMQLGGDDDECTSRLSMFILATAWNEAKVLRIVVDAWLFCSQRRLLRPTNPYVVFAAGTNIKTHQDSHGILKRNHSELRTIQSHQGGNVKQTQNYNAHQEKLAIQNHSEPFESPSNSRCPLRCRNQRNWTTGVCDCVWLSMPQRSNVTGSGSSLRVFSLRFPCVGCQVPLADSGSSSTESIAAL